MNPEIERLRRGKLADLLEPGEIVQRKSYAEGTIYRADYLAGDLVMTDRRLLWFKHYKGLDRLRGSMNGVVLLRIADIESVELNEWGWLRDQMALVNLAGGQLRFHIPEWTLLTIPRAMRNRSIYPRPSETVEWVNALQALVEARG